MKNIRIEKITEIDINICNFFNKDIDCVQYLISGHRNLNEMGFFDRNDVDILKIPISGVNVFFNKIDCYNDEFWERVDVTCIPICKMLFTGIKIIYDDKNILIDAYKLSNSCRRKLQKEKVIVGNILYSDGTYNIL